MALHADAVPRKKVAIIGSGSAGIGALWALNRTHHDVYMYEATDRLGGHANTVEFQNGRYKTLVDTGFMALNTATYRRSSLSLSLSALDTHTTCSTANFSAFLEATKTPTVPTQMTYAVSRDEGAFEWAGKSLRAAFAQQRNMLSLRMWRMLFDIIRFNQFALDLFMVDQNNEECTHADGCQHTERVETIAQYLERKGYSRAFREHYLIPRVAAAWSTSPEDCPLELPAVTLVRFM